MQKTAQCYVHCEKHRQAKSAEASGVLLQGLGEDVAKPKSRLEREKEAAAALRASSDSQPLRRSITNVRSKVPSTVVITAPDTGPGVKVVPEQSSPVLVPGSSLTIALERCVVRQITENRMHVRKS